MPQGKSRSQRTALAVGNVSKVTAASCKQALREGPIRRYRASARAKEVRHTAAHTAEGTHRAESPADGSPDAHKEGDAT